MKKSKFSSNNIRRIRSKKINTKAIHARNVLHLRNKIDPEGIDLTEK